MYNVYSVSLLLFTNAVMAAKARYFKILYFTLDIQ